MISARNEHVATKYQRVFDDLRKEILSGKYQPGQKLPSEADLVKRFGASRITVGRAVRELQERNLVERRAGSGTYIRADHSRGLSFGLIIPDLGRTDIFEPICQGMTDAPQAADHVLLWGNGGQAAPDFSGASTRDRQEAAWRLGQQYILREVAGVFFAPLERAGSDDHTNDRIVAALEKARIPLVLLDRDFLPYPHRSRHDLVGIDNRRAGFMMTDHLLRHGCQRPVFLTYSDAPPTSSERAAGYREALYLHRGEAARPAVVCLDLEESAAIGRAVVESQADAVVCVNDFTAGTLLRILPTVGLRVPQDVWVTGIDDVSYAGLLPVPLTTLRQPCREIGMAAMAVMLDRIAYPKQPMRDVRLACKLVVRDSCGTKRTGAEV